MVINQAPLVTDRACLTSLCACCLPAQEADADANAATKLAKTLSNPVAALISVPFQNNFDFGAGPNGVLLKQQNGWTYGLLGNHLWSFAGESNRAEVNATFLQPFLTYTTKRQTTFSLNTESTYDWD